MYVWWATGTECVSALARLEREGGDASEGLERLDVFAESWREVAATDPVRRAAARLLRVHPLRAADALQLAAAIVASEGEPRTLPLVTFDERLADAADRARASPWSGHERGIVRAEGTAGTVAVPTTTVTRIRHVTSPTPPAEAEHSDFIRDIVAADLEAGRCDDGRHPLPARAQRPSAHRPRQVDRPQLRHRPGVRRPLPPALRRHQPDQGGAGVHRRHQARRALARLRLGRAPLLRLGLLRAALRVGRPPHRGGPGLRRRPERRGDPRVPRHADRARARRAPTATAPSRRTSTCSRRMRAGEFPDGGPVLRAKIDMASPNINMRDPVLYRIVHASHPRTGDAWCIYPTYDFAHGQADAIEGITHSICTLEFENHRPLYDWFLEHLPVPSRPHQYEFAPPQPHLDRALQALPAAPRGGGPRARLGRPAHAHHRRPAPPRLPAGGHPRLPRPSIGVAKREATVEIGQLEYHVRQVLNRDAQRRMAVLRPAQGRHHQLSRRARPTSSTRSTTPRTSRPARERCPSLASSGSSATTSWRIRRASSSGWLRAARCACATPTSSPATRWSRTPTARSSSCAAPTTPRRAAATRPTAAGPRPRSTGSRPSMPCRPRCASTSRCSRGPTPVPRATCWPTSNPDSETILAELLPGARRGRDAGRRDGPVRAAGLLLRRPRLDAGPPGLRPHGHAQGHLGQAAEAGPAEVVR